MISWREHAFRVPMTDQNSMARSVWLARCPLIGILQWEIVWIARMDEPIILNWENASVRIKIHSMMVLIASSAIIPNILTMSCWNAWAAHQTKSMISIWRNVQGALRIALCLKKIVALLAQMELSGTLVSSNVQLVQEDASTTKQKSYANALKDSSGLTQNAYTVLFLNTLTMDWRSVWDVLQTPFIALNRECVSSVLEKLPTTMV